MYWQDYKRNNIQIVKAVATLLVILIHTSAYWSYDYVIFPFLASCVGIFIFISGYLTKTEISDVSTFYKRRLVKVLIPYVICSLGYCLLTSSWDDLLLRLLTGRCNSTYYYIFVFVQLILLTPLIAKVVKSRFYPILYLITPVVILIEEAQIHEGLFLIFPYNINNCLVWISYFALGMRLRYVEDRDNYFIENNKKDFALISFVITTLGLIFQYLESDYWRGFGRMDMPTSMAKVSVFITTIGLCGLAKYFIENAGENGENSLIRRGLKAVGDKAFEIYLLHQFTMKIFSRVEAIDSLNPFPKAAVVFVVTLVAIYILQSGHSGIKKILNRKES
ncbi:MAG: acyltransferase [Lachnospiraceae bacterium]|nr:acyltransferase [Lachnospiraceae bacterium]